MESDKLKPKTLNYKPKGFRPTCNFPSKPAFFFKKIFVTNLKLYLLAIIKNNHQD